MSVSVSVSAALLQAKAKKIRDAASDKVMKVT
jgi:hypothetical protein